MTAQTDMSGDHRGPIGGPGRVAATTFTADDRQQRKAPGGWCRPNRHHRHPSDSADGRGLRWSPMEAALGYQMEEVVLSKASPALSPL
jgi:hypothetical protein